MFELVLPVLANVELDSHFTLSNSVVKQAYPALGKGVLSYLSVLINGKQQLSQTRHYAAAANFSEFNIASRTCLNSGAIS